MRCDVREVVGLRRSVFLVGGSRARVRCVMIDDR
jgi:hypothetical protein